jgi:hypothetical protein
VTTLGELLYALVVTPPPDAGEVYSLAAGGSLFELYGGDGHADCDLSVYCRNPLHPGPCKGWKKHLGVTAPGVLSALEKIRKEKLAESRAKRAAAKAEAEKIVHGKLGHGSHPLYQKQLTVKHAKTILTGDENKAVHQASKVILNKAEIRRYSKLKAAQIAANGGKWAGVADQAAYSKSLEQQIGNALALDNKEGSTHHLTNLLSDHASALSAQFANRQMPGCAKGDHDCDGVAYEALKDHLSTSLFRGLRDGNMDEADRQADEVKALGGDPAKIRAWLKKEGVDFEAPAMEVTPPATPPAKVGGPVYTTVKAAGLKPGDKVHLHVVSHDGQKHVASTKDAGNTHTVLATIDAPQGGKTVFHDDATGDKIMGGAAAKKYFLTEAEGHPLTKPAPLKPKATAAKVEQQLNAPDKLGDKLDQAFGPAPAKLSPNAQYAKDIATGVKSAGTLGKLGGYKKLTKEEFDSLDQDTKDKITNWLDNTAADTSNMGVINAIAGINKKLGIGEPSKPNDLTPNEAAPAVPKAAEWTQPGKFDGWLPSQDVKKIIVGAKTPSSDTEAAAWVESVAKLPKSQFDNLVPNAQDDILKGLADEHQMALDLAATDSADAIEEIHKKLTGLGIPKMATMPDFQESPGSGPAPGEPNPIEHLADLGVSNGQLMQALADHPEAYDELPDFTKAQVKGALQAKYDIGTPEEVGQAQSLAVLHSIKLEGKDKAGFAETNLGPLGAPKSETLTKLLEHAKPKEQGGKWALAKTKLPLYEQLTDEDLATLTPEEKTLLVKDLQEMSLKFKDPKKVGVTAGILLKIHKSQGGGAGAGGTSHIETPAKAELDAELKVVTANNVAKMHEVVKKVTGTELSPSAQSGITDKIAGWLAAGDDEKLQHAVDGPASALANSAALNNPYLEPHKGDLHQALAADLFHLLKNDHQPTPVLDAVNKWGTTKVLPANAAAKIVDALANHPGQQGVPGHTMSDKTLAHELASHAGEVGLPSVYDPSDYPVVSKWLGSHALDNAMVDAGIDANDLYDALGDLGLSVHDEAKAKLQADYLQALFDGKTTPGGLAGELPEILSQAHVQWLEALDKNGWADGSPGGHALKAGFVAGGIQKSLNGHSAGSGGASTSTPGQVKEAVAEALTPAGELTDGQKISLKQAYKSFGSTSYLKESTVEQNFDNLLAVASAYSGEEGMGQLTFGKVMDAIDEQMATELGVVNGKLLRKKITDWLGTPGGKGYADTATPKGQLLTQLTGKIAEQKEIAEWQKKNALPKYPGPGGFDTAKQASDFKPHTVASSKVLHDATLKKLGKKISPAQKQAIVSYTGTGASYINDWLRTGKSYGGINTIKEAHLLAEAMYPIQEDMKLLRRTGWEFVPPQFRSYEAIQKLIGGTFHDPAFLSTTVFAQPGSYGQGLPVELHIEAPKGTQGFHADHWSAFKGKENEFLLGAGQTLQIMGVKKKGSKVVVDVRVVTE